MKRVRQLTSVVVAAGLMAAIPLNMAGAGSKKQTGGDGQAAVCAYLWSIITYPNVSPTIRAAALSTYLSQGCAL